MGLIDLELVASPLAPGISPVRIHYRDAGAGAPLLVLHGGWGYAIYPFDRQIAALAATQRIVIPDRSGYGGSGRIESQASDFHRRAADETFAVMDALGLERPIVWGHSDGAVIALLMGLAAPGRLRGIIAEATHLFRRKPASREFFETMRDHPDAFGARVASVLQQEHGDRWRPLLAISGAAWLRIGDESPAPDADLYDGGLGALEVPTQVIHGARDPRTEPGELDALRRGLARATRTRTGEANRVAILSEGGHSPHSERATADEVTRVAARFISSLA